MMYLLYDSSLIDEEELKKISLEIKKSFDKVPVKKQFRKNLVNFEKESIIFLICSDYDLKEWIENAKNRPYTLFIIPNEKNRLAQKIFKLPSDLNSYFNLAKFLTHLTFIDNNLVLDKGVLANKDSIKHQNLLLSFLKNINNLKLFKAVVRVNDKSFSTASLMVEISNEFVMKEKNYPFFDDSNSCDRSGVVLYSPTSIIEAIKLKFYLLKKSFLPKGLGVIKSKNIELQSDDNLTLIIDSKEYPFKKRILIKTINTNLQIATMWQNCQPSQKDSIRIDTLPKDEELIELYTKKSLPLFPIANEESFAELFKKIRENAKLSATYLTLLIVSILMATIGLFQNSAPTIIGAMIIAPLMAPVISLSMGVIRFEKSIFLQSIKTILFSIVIALFITSIFAYLLPYYHITEQMTQRTHPTLLDLAVAILAGIIGAYGYANSKVGESLAGVAIAVALIPPLCVAGIGLGWQNMGMFLQAFLLFLANIIGIAFAAGVVFYILGFASKRYVTAAFIIKILMLIIIALPLYITTKNSFEYEKIYKKISKTKFSDTIITLNSIYEKNKKLYIELEIAAKTKKDAVKVLDELKSEFKNYHFVVVYKIIK